MSHWLVTGGAGFIGTNFVREAHARGLAKLTILDQLTYAGSLSNIAQIVDDEHVTFVRGDINDAAVVDRLFAADPIDVVVHLAAESHVDRSIATPRSFLETNILGTYTLLDAALRHWRGAYDQHRFLHVSTDEVYGSLQADESPFTEASPQRPNSPYSASKASADHLVRAWGKTYGLPTIVTHCSNNYGPWQWPEKLIPLVIHNALTGQPLPIYGDGRQVRDWIHVLDHCDALFATIERGALGENYIIGAQNEWTNLKLVRSICEHVDRLTGNAPGTSVKLIEHVRDRPGHDVRYAVDASKARDHLGWRPTRDFEESIGEVVRWYVENEEWVRAQRERHD
ncbi:MAG: dTDP-glucose 4,6-dehydratase [Gammaproteobacteria bacterium]|nr:dTDP-glucose 4,6-dehydratase [Gammaproteobacteria bacterium]